MKLRTRLYLWISTLFILFFLVAYFIEIHLVNSHLQESEKEMEEKIESVNEEKRKDLEEYLGIEIADIQAQIDALLFRIDEYSYLKSGFVPSLENEQGKTWTSTATILLHYKWINYIQNTINGKVASLIIPSYQDLHPIDYYPINEDLFWVFIRDKTIFPYLAIRITLKDVAGASPGLVDIDTGKFTNIYILFNYQTLLHFEKPPDLNVEGYNFVDTQANIQRKQEISLLREATLKKIQLAQQFLQTLPLEKFEEFSHEQLLDYIQKNYSKTLTLEGHERSIPFSVLEKGAKGVTDLVDQEFIRTFYKTRDRDDAIVLTWALTTFLSTDLFGTDPLSDKAPAGIASILPGVKLGSALLSKGTFYSHPFFDDKAYSKNNSKDNTTIPSSIALIEMPETRELFVGNALALKENKRNSFLTVAVGISNLLQKLSLASGKIVSLVHQDKVINVFDSEGKELSTSSFYHLPLAKMQKTKGTIKIEGKKYYYLKLQPYEKVDLHFYLFELKDEAFSFVLFIQQSLSDVISQISWNMRLIALVALICALLILEVIARKITRPIAQLAEATKPVAEGHYDKVNLPEVSSSTKDEINILCQSFTQMIQGLKDREKVKGVLNKVVSKDIAEEILKGNVSLGGEEKEASIIFADIRNFTELTEKMRPVEVIDLLNTCMTKISQVVDEFGGVIDKYIGDEAMALYGAPISQKDHAKKACLSALEMVKRIEEWNTQRETDNLPPVHIGIGICTGIVVAGNMGAENRLNYTVLGANVNLGARLCAIAKPKEIIISENTKNALTEQDNIQLEPKDPVVLKGFSEPIPVYKIRKKHE